MSGESPRPNQREVIFEIRRIGAVQRVAAIDAETGLEVVIQAPASAASHDVRALALAKLERALKGESENENAPPAGRGGKLI